MNITEPFRRLARLMPTAPAIIRADGSTISYGLLDHAIDTIGAHAIRLGLKPGDIAALRITGPDESIGLILVLGLARIGVVTTDATLPSPPVALRFHAGSGTAPGAITVDAGWLPDGPADPGAPPPPIHRDSASIFRITESSGTTGMPKPVVVTHEQMTQRQLLHQLMEPSGPDTRRVVGVGFDCNIGMQYVLLTLWAGGTLVLSSPPRIAEALTRHGVTTIVTTPATLRAMLDGLPDDAGPFPSLRTVHTGGSLLPPALHRLTAERLTPEIHAIMGATEISAIASGPMRDMVNKPDSVGTIWPGIDVEALDEAGHPLPVGQTGVLRIRSPLLASGYLHADDDAAERFQDGWFYASDIGTVWPDGTLTLSGRTSEAINAGGQKVHPHIIEQALLKLPTVLEAAAFGVPDSSGVVRIQAAIVARAPIEDAVLITFCQRALGPIAPVGILQMKALPRNANGKILRERLADTAMRLMHEAATGS
ncbi:MAG: long-chain fatty acid--CoA ligase [Acetobacteraceae bacterium]